MVADISSIGGTSVVEVPARKVFARLSRLECADVSSAKLERERKCRVTRFWRWVGDGLEITKNAATSEKV